MTWQDIRYFTPDEFKCSHCDSMNMDTAFVMLLDRMREELGFPFVITSGYRCPKHPIEAAKAVPGAHSTGKAADIAVHGRRAYDLIALALDRGVTGIGVAQKGNMESRFIHLDIRDDDKAQRPWLWSYG